MTSSFSDPGPRLLPTGANCLTSQRVASIRSQRSVCVDRIPQPGRSSHHYRRTAYAHRTCHITSVLVAHEHEREVRSAGQIALKRLHRCCRQDFLAGGTTADALIRLCRMAGAIVVGGGFLIEKLNDAGRVFLSGYQVR